MRAREGARSVREALDGLRRRSKIAPESLIRAFPRVLARSKPDAPRLFPPRKLPVKERSLSFMRKERSCRAYSREIDAPFSSARAA